MLELKRAHAGYRLMTQDEYQRLRDAYYGTGGFLDGSYIEKFTREHDAKIRMRRAIAYYLNYLAPVVNSHVGPVFSKTTSRDWGSGDELLAAFIEDTDRCGTPMAQFMKSAALTAKLFGTVYIVVDNVTDDEQRVRKSDALSARAFPYAYLVHPKDVINIECSRFGELTRFRYYDGYDERDSQLTREWTRESWALEGASSGPQSGDNPLGRIPVIALHSRRAVRMEGVSDGWLPQPSEFLSIMKANTRIFNLCSELDEILRNQAFSIFLYPAKDPGELTVGTDSAIGFDGENVKFAPHFVTPSPDGANLIMQQTDRLIKEIYRMAMLTHTTGVQESSSGIAKAWDFEKTNQALADFAMNLQEAECRIVDLFGAWTQAEIDYICRYPRDFSIMDTQQEIADTISLLDMNLKANFAAAVKKKLARTVLEGAVPDDEYDRVIQELDDEARDAVYGDRLENPSADDSYTAVGIAQSVVELLEKVREGALAPEAAKIILVVTFRFSEAAADAAIKAQRGERAELPESESTDAPPERPKRRSRKARPPAEPPIEPREEETEAPEE